MLIFEGSISNSDEIEFILPLFRKLKLLHRVIKLIEGPTPKWQLLSWEEQFLLLAYLEATTESELFVDFDFDHVWINPKANSAIKMQKVLQDLFQDSCLSCIIGA